MPRNLYRKQPFTPSLILGFRLADAEKFILKTAIYPKPDSRIQAGRLKLNSQSIHERIVSHSVSLSATMAAIPGCRAERSPAAPARRRRGNGRTSAAAAAASSDRTGDGMRADLLAWNRIV